MEKEIIDLITPDLGDADKIELVKWYVEPGQIVEEGQELLELVTDKAAFPMESPSNGKITEILRQSGELVKKNEILGKMELN